MSVYLIRTKTYNMSESGSSSSSTTTTTSTFIDGKVLKEVWVAVDIEKAGSNIIQHPVISVGFCVGYMNDVFEKQRFNLPVTWPKVNISDNSIHYGDFEPKCFDEFWSKMPPEMIEGCKTDLYGSHTDAWIAIGKWIDALEMKYPNAKVKFLTDNASYDVATIDYNLEFYTHRSPMRYSTKGKYRSVKSADDMFDMLPRVCKDVYRKLIEKIAPHDHNPCNDAHNIMLQYYHAQGGTE